MRNIREEELKKEKEKIDELPVPSIQLHDAISRGVNRGVIEQKRRYKRYTLLIAASLLCFSLIGTIRVSDTVAAFIGEIPGLEKLVIAVRGDTSLISSLYHDYLYPIDKTLDNHGKKLYIDSLIVDEERIVVFYKHDSSWGKETSIIPSIKGKNSEELMYSSSFYSPASDAQENMHTLQVYFFENGPLDVGSLDFHLTNDNRKVMNTWELPIQFSEEDIIPSKEYNVKMEAVIHGQRIMVNKVKVSPTSVAISVTSDSNNTYQFFGFENLHLQDTKGNKWLPEDSRTSSGEKDDWIFYTSSPFFENPEELYVVFDGIKAIPKNDMEVIIDVENRKILRSPKDMNLSIKEIEGEQVVLSHIKQNEENTFMSVFGDVVDNLGNEYRISTVSSGEVPGELHYFLPQEIEGSTITLQINGTSNVLQKETRIKVK
ncbi:DUF4179 domain-containing protein [Mangrovibacillus cuniculi]|uniref:DUF4179 domain-containing protein n=1 Tax=Mangrovibacillus cuniculi TaxID=2593652 RepID=A0A7S8CCS8_9BACI|nr:DUF4179 domain-containing protein [Mangrovibacillus cuniculi]QPC47624.1 DUF4179 domain-containing protein [Mangrovibacillus cuniculi]